MNHPFMCIRVSAEGVVAVVEVAFEEEGGCVPRGLVVCGEVGSGRVRHHHHIGLVRRLGGNVVTCFCMHALTGGTAYSVVGGCVLCRWRHTLSVSGSEAKMEVSANCEEV